MSDFIAESKKAEKACGIIVAVYPTRKVDMRTVGVGPKGVQKGANTSNQGIIVEKIRVPMDVLEP